MQPLPENPRPPNQQPAIAIYRGPLFNPSETFVRAHAQALTRYRPLLVGLEDKGNVPPELRAATFLPHGSIEAVLARLGMWEGLAERLRGERPALVHAHFAP